MSYVDAMFDRDADIIRVVERKEGKRHFTEYPIKYTFYYIQVYAITVIHIEILSCV